MKSWFLPYSVIIVLFLTACFKKESTLVENTQPASEQKLAVPKKLSANIKTSKGYATKEQRESVYFAASLEREALKLITKDNRFEKGSLFSALSYIFETDAGQKRMFPANIDCSRFRIEKKDSSLLIYKTCQKPEVLAIEVKSRLEGAELEANFKSAEWSSVLGTSVALTNSDVRCQLLIREKRLVSMNCQNWAYLVSEDKLSSTEIRLKLFAFDRNNQVQLQLKGGFFKDLVETKKIEIMVPLSGQIKVIEREIEVIDDFAEKPKPELKPEPKKLKPLIIGGPNGQNEKISEKNSEKANEKTNQEDRQKSQEPSEDRSQYQNESREEIERREAEQRVREENTESDQNNGGVPKSNGVPEAPHRGR